MRTRTVTTPLRHIVELRATNEHGIWKASCFYGAVYSVAGEFDEPEAALDAALQPAIRLADAPSSGSVIYDDDDPMDKLALVSLTFDDGLRCQFERALPILDQHGFLATFFLVANSDRIHTDGHTHPDWRKTDWSEQDIQLFKSMVQRGHEIGAHSVSHRLPELNNDPKAEAEKSKEWIERRLQVQTPSYCYPFYHITEPIKKAVTSAGYEQARGGATGLSYYSPGNSVDWLNIDCRQIAKNENVGGWIRSGCWHVLTFHGIGDERDGWEPITVTEFARQMAELAQYRDSGAVEVVTFKDGAERLRQSK